MPDLKEKVDKLVKNFVDAVDEVEKDINEKDSEAYKNFMNYDSSYLSDTDIEKLNSRADFPKPDENIYFVKGRGDKKGKMFKNFDEAKSYAIETNKFLFQINGSDFYDKKMELKSLKQIDLTKDYSKKESVLGKIADYKKEEKSMTKTKIEKSKDMGVEI